MLRSSVIQELLNLYDAPLYLEIGVNAGVTFFPLVAERKIAVDPNFLFSTSEAAAKDPTAVFHSMASDDYFHNVHGRDGPFDVVFLDGLHTFEQTLRDLMNTISCVSHDSIIVIDDILPDGYCASVGDLATFYQVRAATLEGNGNWMGDVYRLAYFIAAFMPIYRYATVAENHGQLVMWREARAHVDLGVEAVARKSYTDVVLNREIFNITPFGDIMSAISAWRRQSCSTTSVDG